MNRARNLGQPVSLRMFEASLLPRGGRRPGLQWTPRTRTGLRAAIVLSWNLAFWNDVRRCGGTGRTRHPGCRLIATSGIFAQNDIWVPAASNHTVTTVLGAERAATGESWREMAVLWRPESLSSRLIDARVHGVANAPVPHSQMSHYVVRLVVPVRGGQSTMLLGYSDCRISIAHFAAGRDVPRRISDATTGAQPRRASESSARSLTVSGQATAMLQAGWSGEF